MFRSVILTSWLAHDYHYTLTSAIIHPLFMSWVLDTLNSSHLHRYWLIHHELHSKPFTLNLNTKTIFYSKYWKWLLTYHSQHKASTGKSIVTSHMKGVGRLPPGWCLPEVFYPYTFCNLIGLEQWYFNLIWNTYMWKLQNFCR